MPDNEFINLQLRRYEPPEYIHKPNLEIMKIRPVKEIDEEIKKLEKRVKQLNKPKK